MNTNVTVSKDFCLLPMNPLDFDIYSMLIEKKNHKDPTLTLYSRDTAVMLLDFIEYLIRTLLLIVSHQIKVSESPSSL